MLAKLRGNSKKVAAGEGPSTRAKKATAAEKGKKKKGESSSRREEPDVKPEDFRFSLRSEEENLRFQRLCQLPHKQCRFQDMVAMTNMGIADNVLALSSFVGLCPLFQANYYAYKGLTLEFLSTMVVEKRHGIPTRMKFQLGGQRLVLSNNDVNTLLQGPENGAYVGNHEFYSHDLCGKIAWRHDKAMRSTIQGWLMVPR